MQTTRRLLQLGFLALTLVGVFVVGSENANQAAALSAARILAMKTSSSPRFPDDEHLHNPVCSPSRKGLGRFC